LRNSEIEATIHLTSPIVPPPIRAGVSPVPALSRTSVHQLPGLGSP
jgi:hypothetical protein